VIKGAFMAGPRPEKVAVVEEVREHLDNSGAAILTEYRGLKVGDLATLRRQLRTAGAEYKIFKNTLVRRATAGTERTALDPFLEGPTAIAFVRDDIGAVAKVLREFSKAHPELVVKGGLLGTKVVDAQGASALADLPTREVLLAQLAGAIAGAAAIYLTLGRLATVTAGGGVTAYNPATMGFGRGMLIEAIGTFMLVFVIYGVIDHRAVPGWAPMAIGAIVFAIIIILGPATGAAINPARYLGAVFMLKAFGGHVLWSQVPAYLIGELAGGVLGGLAWVGIGRVREDAAMSSLAPSDSENTEKVPEGAS